MTSLLNVFLLLLGAEVRATTLAKGSSFEWAGTFATPQSAYNWIAEKMVCHYVDDHMKIVVLGIDSATANSEASLAAKEAEAEALVANTCPEVEAGETLTASSTTCYELHFDTNAAISTFTLAPGGASHIAVFTQHVPTEFEKTQHYFQDTAANGGGDVEPIKQLQAAAAPAAAADPHAGHNHGRRLSAGHEEAYEWAGTFETSGSHYVWTAQKATRGDYADASMKLVVLPAAGTDAATLEGLESTADTALDGTCTSVTSGTTLTPGTGCYKLEFDCTQHTSTFPIDATGVDHIAFFAEHHPIEFERDAHYLKDKKANDIEPVSELPIAASPPPVDGPEKPWGKAIGAAIIVNLCTLLGVIFLVPALLAWAKANPSVFFATMNAGAAGAILACTFFLLLFEATHLVPTPGEPEAETTGKWGAMVLTGFLCPFVFDIIISGLCDKGGRDASSGKVANSNGCSSTSSSSSSSSVEPIGTNQSPPPSPPPSPPSEGTLAVKSQPRVLSGVLLGDFMHNFVDGIFIGAAFMNCDDTKGWVVTAATVYHELGQELADYVILTDPQQGRLKPLLALSLNFISGISVLLGVIVILAADVDNYTQGMLLAFGGGVYIHIGAAECMPQVYEHAKSVALRMGSLLSFCIGCIAIGLVLLDHEHCFPEVAEGEADPHAGHNHGRMLSDMLSHLF